MANSMFAPFPDLRVRLTPAAFAVVVVAGCSSQRAVQKGGPHHVPKPLPVSGACAPTRRTPLHYEVQGTPTRLAFVHATINDTATVLLLDSGATDHALAKWFADRLHVETYSDPADVAVDHDGNHIAAERARAVRMSLDGWGEITGGSAPFVMDMPAILEEHGIGGILAPQLLRSAGQSLVLELADGWLRLEATGCTERQHNPPSGCELSPAPLKPCAPASKGVGTLFALPAVVAGVATHLVVDTGARETDVFRSSTAGGHLAATPSQRTTPGYVASGESPGLQVDSVAISAGSCSFNGSVTVVSGASGALCSRDGALGIDFLRSCELVIDDRGLGGTCRLASAPR